MIQFINIQHQFGSTVLFEGFNWHIKSNSKIGLIGPNGSGKTTLFRIAKNEIKPDSGEVICSKSTVISVFQQIPDFPPENTVLDTVLISNDLYRAYIQKKTKLDNNFDSVSPESKEFEDLLHKQSELEDFANANGLHELEFESKKFLNGLGFNESQLQFPIKNFSPGYHHRIGLAIALLNKHNLLLLDEPTNHLDDQSKVWLSEYLSNTKTSFILVTHDPEFLNKTTNTIAEISPKGVWEFKGNLEEFLEEKNDIHEKLKLQFKKEVAYVQKRMEWINRFRAKASKATQAQSALKRLEKRDKVENPDEVFWNREVDYRFHFVSDGRISFRLENASFQYDSSGRTIFKNVHFDVSSGEKIALVGPNGAGKSTLMRCILEKHILTEGSLYFGPKTKIGYFSQTHDVDLFEDKNIIENVFTKYPDISDLQARNILGHFSFTGDSVYKKVALLSGGEKSRLRLAILVLYPCNVLLLDEPTNHLDMVIRKALKSALIEFSGSILVISHDPDFLVGLCNKTFELSNGTLKDLNCNFEEYTQKYKDLKDTKEEKIQSKEKSNYVRSNTEKNRIRKLEKLIPEIEQQVLNLENQKSDFEKKMSSPEFYTSKNMQSNYDEYESIKASLNQKIEEWEKYQLELEGLKE